MHTVRHSGGQRRAAVHGFTLIELLVTITLLGVLVTLSIPSFTGWIRNSQIRTVADALQTGLRTAQAESVRRNRQVVMWFTNDDPSAGVSGSTKCSGAAPAPIGTGKRWVIQTVPGPWGEETSGCTNAEYITGGKLADIASAVTISNGPVAMCFNSAGRLASTAAGSAGTGVSASCTGALTSFDIDTAGADRPLRVIVQIGGQLRMCDPKRPTMSSASPDGCP